MDAKGEDILHYRVDQLEKNLGDLAGDVRLLNKALWMMMGALTLVNVVLPLAEKFSGG